MKHTDRLPEGRRSNASSWGKGGGEEQEILKGGGVHRGYSGDIAIRWKGPGESRGDGKAKHVRKESKKTLNRLQSLSMSTRERQQALGQ